MAVRKKTPRKKATRKKGTGKRTRRAASTRKRIAPRKEKRGLEARATPLPQGAPELGGLVASVEELGGAPIGAYREPLSGSPLLLAVVPVDAVDPTPFQRDLSPAHVKRLAEKIEESGAFLDPLAAVLSPEGRIWTPNGRHRLAAAKLLGLRSVTILISADAGLAYRILALNTEKAHNLRDRALEVIRMARSIAAAQPRAKETDFADELESGALLTLGIVYDESKRFPGGAYHPMLRRIDHFSDRTLRRSLDEREGWAARLIEIDAQVKQIVARLQARGFRSPYLRNYVVARINPVRPRGRGRGAEWPKMAVPAALTRMAAAVRRFDVDSVRERDLALVATVAGPADED